MGITIIVCGGRHFNDEKFVFSSLNKVNRKYGISLLIHGGASGADLIAEKWAIENGIKFQSYPADWEKYGRAAGPIRNREMLKALPDGVVAFEGGRGTQDMIKKSIAANIPVWIPNNSNRKIST